MEQVRDLNIEADDMQVVLSAISGVSKRIKEVAQTHKPLFGDERGCVKMSTSSFFMHKAPTFSSQGFAIS